MKRAYVGAMRGVLNTGNLAWLEQSGREAEPFGWKRWAASLLAIHDVKRMVELDLPWWNVAATREVETFLAVHPNARVFEYGAGASSAWLAARSGELVSVEHDAGWHVLISPLIGTFSNAVVWHRDLAGEGYIGAIGEAGGLFDLIVIDGRRRVECLARAIPHLKPGGIILFDDSGRKRYRADIERCGLREQHYFGRSYCVPYPDHTSVLHG
ncbi:MAG: class I SAM-dependent methyltransferase [Porphyrobacter sp.]|nr:class I SAM-dependent methyltransferase [Porphyrobacter sp.]